MSLRGRPTIIKDGKRRCADCGETKITDQFGLRSVCGEIYLMAICLECKTIRDREYCARRLRLNKAVASE